MASDPNQTQQDGTEPSGAEEQDGFGAAFSERAAGPEGKGAEAGDREERSDKEPAEAGSEEAPADTAATDATSGTAEEADPWAGLTPEQLRQRLKDTEAERDRLQASDRSNRGRVGALTKKLNRLSASTPAPSPAPTQEGEGTTEGAATVADLDKRLQAVTDEYGDVVGPIVDVVKEVRAKIEQFESRDRIAAEVEADAEALTAAHEALARVHPDYLAFATDQSFLAWLGDQTPKTNVLANSNDPEDVSLVLSLFKAERSAALASHSGEGGEPGKQEGTATDDRRKRQLDGSKQVPGKGQAAAAGVPNDFGAAFKARAEAHQR